MQEPIVLAFGGGTDSTAVLCGWHEKGLQQTRPITLILFADTGGERPHTYRHLETMQTWLAERGFPPITVVRKTGIPETLEQNCLRKKMLPSLAYGFKSCSQKFKVQPQERFGNNHPPFKEWWKKGQLVTKLIGYEARETKRWERAKKSDDKYEYEFPLVEWGWSRPECQAAILRNGLPLPGKSSCFFCPASTLPELREMKREYPLLFQRALAMEDNAELTSVKGLGRRFNWREWSEREDAAARHLNSDEYRAYLDMIALPDDMVPCDVCID